MPMRSLGPLLLVPFCVACGGGDERAPVLEGATQGPEVAGMGGASMNEPSCPYEPISVLFIGNSYTFYNDLPGLVQGFASASGCTINVQSETPPGIGFAEHVEGGAAAAIGRDNWDVVVLQNQSQRAGLPLEDVEAQSLPHALTLAAWVEENHNPTRLVLYATWGRRDGDTENCSYYPQVCTFDGQTESLFAGYSLYASETGADLSPVGLAWRLVVEDAQAPFDSELLWAPDGSHPTLRGSYLAAAALYESVTQHRPESFAGGLSLPEAAYLRRTAAQALDELD